MTDDANKQSEPEWMVSMPCDQTAPGTVIAAVGGWVRVVIDGIAADGSRAESWMHVGEYAVRCRNDDWTPT